jgi:transcriptional regulator with XRE-family HTH domain
VLRLKEIRKAQGLSRQKLAARADLTEKTIYRAEVGLGVNASTLVAIAKALDVTVGDLFDEEASA